MFKRNLFQKLTKEINSDLYLIITGARQVGKTTLLKQMREFLTQNRIPVFYVNLEDPDYLNLLNEHPRNLLTLFPLPADKKSFFLLDEIQYLDQPTNFLKFLFDEFSHQIKLIVTGSSAFYMDRKFTDSLAGRKRIYTLNTLSLDEFLTFKGLDKLPEIIRNVPVQKLTTQFIPPAFRRELDQYISEYVTFGGYPRVVLAEKDEEKKETLHELLTSYVKKDLLESGIKNDQNAMNLLKILATQTGSLLNINNLSKTLRVSNTAVENYLFILKKSFILYAISPFATNVRNEIKKMPKVFFADLGLRNMLLRDFRHINLKQDKGLIYENFIFRQLLDRVEPDEIKFWRTQQGNEIDFIIRDKLAYEIKYNIDVLSLKKYQRFAKQYPDMELRFIYRDGSPSDELRQHALRF